MVITSHSAQDAARKITQQINVALHHIDVVMHVLIATAEKARATAAQADIDLLVCSEVDQQPG